MITKPAYNKYLNDLDEILNHFSCDGGEEKLGSKYYPSHKNKHDFIIQSMKIEQLNYLYNSAIENRAYDYLIVEKSILQFDYLPNGNLRYCFIEYPLKGYVSYKTYLEKNDIEDNDFVLFEIYEQRLLERDIKKHINYIRYDFSPDQNRGYIHPLSHFHFGIQNEMRLPFYGCLTPVMFFCFILKHCYYKYWLNLMENRDFEKIYLDAKLGCVYQDKKFLTHHELSELYLV